MMKLRRKEDASPGILPFIRFKLMTKMIALISLLIIAIFIIFMVFLQSFIADTVENQIGTRALGIAKSIANIPELRDAFLLENPSTVIQEIVAPIQEDTEAEFIVIGNTESIRYAHPDQQKIGKKMVGEDNDRALLMGQSYISKQTGSLGLSVRGKVPIYNEANEIIGIVSVGFLNEDIEEIIEDQSESLWLTLVIIVLLGLLGAIFISHYIKKSLSNMEPEEIAHVNAQKEAILQSTHEGMIATDKKGLITMMNTAAQQIIFRREKQGEEYIGLSIQDVFPHTNTMVKLEQEESDFDREMIVGDDVVLVTQTPIYSDKEITGAVLTFRKKTEMEGVIKELSRIKQYANAQRAQTHEYSNKLYTILGLLQLDQKQEAINFIKRENSTQQKWQRFLTAHVSDPLIQALLLGKFNQANELGISLSIHPDSHLAYHFSQAKKDALLTALGNVIENAIESLKMKEINEQKISIFFTDIGEDIIFEIEDSGPGIAAENISTIFQQGFSTKKGAHRGTGLALSSYVIDQIGGQIMLEDSDLGGACFVIIIPKEGGTINE